MTEKIDWCKVGEVSALYDVLLVSVEATVAVVAWVEIDEAVSFRTGGVAGCKPRGEVAERAKDEAEPNGTGRGGLPELAVTGRSEPMPEADGVDCRRVGVSLGLGIGSELRGGDGAANALGERGVLEAIMLTIPEVAGGEVAAGSSAGGGAGGSSVELRIGFMTM